MVSSVSSVERVSTWWISAFVLATAGIYAGIYGPVQILLGQQADLMYPGGKEALLGLAVGVGACSAMVANPLWGALSDRSNSRFGRRLPWLAGGVVVGAVGLLLLGTADNPIAMIAGWALTQAALSAPVTMLNAAVADQVPVNQRGTVGGWFGMALTVGILIGTGLAVSAGSVATGYLLCAGFAVVSVIPYLLVRHAAAEVGRRHETSFWQGFRISPSRHPDFVWAWLTRFGINLGNSIGLLYLLYYLKDAVRLDDPEGGVLILTGLYSTVLLVAAALGGIWSDRVGKRKVFVICAGVVMSLAAASLAFWPTWTGTVVASVVLGTSFGIYLAVDFALITETMPEALDYGKDLGLVSITVWLPQVLAPLIAAPIVTTFGFPTLYLVAAAVGLTGSALVTRIRSVP